MASAAEAELSAMFENSMKGIIIRGTIIDLGHLQPPTPIRTDNTTAVGIVFNNIKQVRSRTMDMRFHIIRDRMLQGQFHVYWDRGEDNLGDYYTKHHPPWHQFKMCPKVLNNPPGTKYHSSKGVLVVPRRGPKLRIPRITTDVINDVKRKRNMLETYMTKLRSVIL